MNSCYVSHFFGQGKNQQRVDITLCFATKAVVKSGCFCCLFLILALPAFAVDPAAKIPPSPAQGTVNSVGKFTPASQEIGTNENMSGLPKESGQDQALDIKQTGAGTFQIGLVTFDQKKRIVRLPATVCIRDQVIEYALVTAGGKTYESLLSTKASPLSIHLAFLLLGVSPLPVSDEAKKPMLVPDSNAVQIEVAWETNGVTTAVPLTKLIRLTSGNADDSGQPFNLNRWLYNGSEFDQRGFAARREGSLVALIRDPVALMNNPGADRANDLIHMPDNRLLPAQGTPVNVILHLYESQPSAAPPPGVTPVTPLSTNR